MPQSRLGSDVEIDRIGELYELTPTTDAGARLLENFLNHPMIRGVPVRMARAEYERFWKSTRKQRVGLMVGVKPKFVGQKRGPAEPLEELPPELAAMITVGRTVILRDHDVTVSTARYGAEVASTDRIYKVTKPEHAPKRSENLSLGTVDYYRATVDAEEGSFVPLRSKAIVATVNGDPVDGANDGHITRIGINPCWIYCTTLVGPNGLDSDQMIWFRDWFAGKALSTPVRVPLHEFARMLGCTFGLWSRYNIRRAYRTLESVETLRQTGNLIMVFHGPVRYMDSEERREHLDRLNRKSERAYALESVFTKTLDFSAEREYRFSIWGWGEPLAEHVVLPTPVQMTDCYGASVPLDTLAEGRPEEELHTTEEAEQPTMSQVLRTTCFCGDDNPAVLARDGTGILRGTRRCRTCGIEFQFRLDDDEVHGTGCAVIEPPELAPNRRRYEEALQAWVRRKPGRKPFTNPDGTYVPTARELGLIGERTGV